MSGNMKRVILLPEKINFRCNKEEKELVIRGAKRNKVTNSEYIRMLIRNDNI